MRKIDAFAHILPAGYLEHLVRHLTSTMRPTELRYYQEGVFRFSPVISDIDARRRSMDRHGDYAQVLVPAVPPLEEVDPRRPPPSWRGAPTTRWPTWCGASPSGSRDSRPPCRWVTSRRL